MQCLHAYLWIRVHMWMLACRPEGKTFGEKSLGCDCCTPYVRQQWLERSMRVLVVGGRVGG